MIGEANFRSLLEGGLKLAERTGDEAYFVGVCIRSGVLSVEAPPKLVRMALAFHRRGLLAGGVAIGAIRHGERVALRDERGEVTYRELERRTDKLANAWRARGLEAGQGVAILARNHRGFADAVFAAAKCGAKIILLNTSFAGPQIREVAEREGTDLLVYDDEYAEALRGVAPRHGCWRAWVQEGDPAALPDTLEALIARGSPQPPPKASRAPKIVILTSGTTGTPKGAPRDVPRSLGILGGLLSKVPFRARETTELAVPLFHAFGFASLALGLALGSTVVVRRRFDPATTLDSIQRNRCSALVVVPVMLQRILDLGEGTVGSHDLTGLKVIFVSGSAVGPALVKRTLSAFGPVLYNMYGSTEIAYVTIAGPDDLAAAPGTVGRVVRGTVAKILDDAGREVAQGASGRIFVGNSTQMEGYTGGENKEIIEGLMSSGDVGHFDEAGRLYIDGRDDEMIVSGGENVFPGEVEECLAAHQAVEEAAVIGVDDERFGQRLRAFVVVRAGREVTEEDLQGHIKDNLAGYKTPREVVFLKELPRNLTGKVLKRELRDAASPSVEAPTAGATVAEGE